MHRQAREQIRLEVARAFYVALQEKLDVLHIKLEAAKLPGEQTELGARARATEAALAATAEEIVLLGGEVPA